MKLLIEVLIAIFLHPVAVVMAWLDLLTRGDMSFSRKLIWGVVCLVWGIGPILYFLLADGELW